MEYAYGWRPGLSNPHESTMMFDAATVAALPPSNSRFSQYLPPIWDQGPLGACTAHGILRAVLFALAKAGASAPMLSRLMLYYNERAKEGTTASDAGAIISDGVDSLVSQGACLESLWPYDVSQFTMQPSQEAVWAAFDQRGKVIAAIPRAPCEC